MKTNKKTLRMRSLFLLLFLPGLINGLSAQVQSMQDDYSSSAPWTAGAGSNPPVVSSNVLNFNATQGSVMNYIYRSIGFTLNSGDSWTADIEFKPVYSGSACPAHTIMSLTAGTTNSWNSSIVGYPASNQDAVEVYYITSYCAGSTTWQLVANAKDGTSWGTASGGINIDPNASPGTTYYIRLQRLSATVGVLNVYSNSSYTTHVSGSPQTFTISSGVTGLTHVQHGCIPQGSSNRKLTATLDNLKISNNSFCEDYTPQNTWTQTGSGSVAIGSNVCQLSAVTGFTDESVHTSLSGMIANSMHWRAETEFSFSSVSSYGPAVGVLCLSDDVTGNIWGYPTLNSQNVVAAYFSSVANGSSADWMIYGTSRSGTTWGTPSNGINLPSLNTTYYIVLERVDATNGQISVYYDAAHTLPVASPECFTIASSVTGLDYLSHTSMEQGSWYRVVSGQIDNTCILNDYGDGGVIGYSDTICCWTAPGILLNLADASYYNCTGSSPTYQWEIESPCGSGNWVAISGANSSTYTPGVLTTTSCFRRAASGSQIPGNMTLYSNTITITVDCPVANAGMDQTLCYSVIGSGLNTGGSPTASGGTPGYTYSWTPATQLSCTTCANPHWSAPAGGGSYTYSVIVTDTLGCSDTDDVVLSLDFTCRLANGAGTTSLVNSIAPNPNDGKFIISFPSGAPQQDIEVTDLWGRSVFRKTGNTSSSVEVDLSGEAKGIYLVKVTSGGQQYIQQVVVQ